MSGKWPSENTERMLLAKPSQSSHAAAFDFDSMLWILALFGLNCHPVFYTVFSSM
jgi:hypothetical protein